MIASSGLAVKVGISLATFLLYFMISYGGGVPASVALLSLALYCLGR